MSAVWAKRSSRVEDRLNRSMPQKRQRTGHRQFQNPNPNAQFQSAHNSPMKGFPANRGGDDPIRPPPQAAVPSQQPMSGSDLLRLHSSITSQREAPKQQQTVWSSPHVSSQFMSDSPSVQSLFRHVNPGCKSGSQIQMQNSFTCSSNLHVMMIPPRNMSNFTPIPVQIPNMTQIPATGHLNLHDKHWNLSQSLNKILPGNALLELMKFIDEAKTQSQQTEENKAVPSEFDAVWLKGRHECVINSLYCEIPRQCSSCGARFMTHEEHSKHMDWHVLKNRARRTTKIKPSRSYYPTASMFVDGNETTAPQVPYRIEKEEEEEPVVPVVEDDQMFCALCQERLEEFFNDAGELMYRGAVFMKAPGGWKLGMETSLLGPIVHAKCLS